MEKEIIDQIKKIFSSHPEVKLAYLFGSRVAGDIGPLSDYDFAVYLDGPAINEMFRTQIELTTELGRFLKTDDVDVVILNKSESPLLNYNVIAEGKLIFEREGYRTLVEPKILSQYFDHTAMLARNNLTKVKA